MLTENDRVIENFLPITEKLNVFICDALKQVKDQPERKIFDPILLVKPNQKEISINENFALIVFWDPNGTKVVRSSLVGLDLGSDDSTLSQEALFS